MTHIFFSGGVISLFFVPKIILSFLFCLSLFILIGCICFSSFSFEWLLMGCFLRLEFSVLTCLFIFLIHGSLFTLYVLPTSLPFTFHCQTLIWLFVFKACSCSFTSHIKISGVKRGTCFYCPSLLYFTNLLLWLVTTFICKLLLSKFLNSQAFSYDLFQLHICSCVNYLLRFNYLLILVFFF